MFGVPAPQTAKGPRPLRALLPNPWAAKNTTLMNRYGFLSVAQVAEELGRARWFVYKLLDDHKLAFHMIGGHRKISQADLDAYVERSRVAALGERKPKAQATVHLTSEGAK